MRHSTILAVVCLAALSANRIALAETTAPLPKPDHIVIVLEENKGYSQVIGSSDAPYINSLALGGALFTDSHGLSHPSQPNYLDLFSGSDHGIKNNNTPKEPLTAPSLGSTLSAAGLQFRGYAEGLPHVGATEGKSGKYARKHCPWVDFSDVAPTQSLPFEDSRLGFPNDAAGFSALPTVSFVVPNLDNDMHDGSVADGDSWLRTHLGAYAQWAKTHNSLLIVTFDEDNGKEGQHIPTLFVGQMVKPGQYAEHITHFNVLRTVEEMYGLPLLGETSATDPIRDVWASDVTASHPLPAPAARI